MARVDGVPVAPDPISYLDAAAATAAAREYKQRLLAGLDVRAGHVVLDVGCGPGTDLARLSDAVGPDGSVIGIDSDPDMVDEARLRLGTHANVEVRAGDAHSLPLPDGCVDRARIDRVLQHLEDPAQALAELRRVIRGGGVLGMAEPDWDTLAIDDIDVETSRTFTRFVSGRTRNGTVGRQLARLAVAAGFIVGMVDATAVVFRDFDAVEQILGLRRNAVRAVRAGELAEASTERWLDRLAAGTFLATFTFFTVIAHV